MNKSIIVMILVVVFVMLLPISGNAQASWLQQSISSQQCGQVSYQQSYYYQECCSSAYSWVSSTGMYTQTTVYYYVQPYPYTGTLGYTVEVYAWSYIGW